MVGKSRRFKAYLFSPLFQGDYEEVESHDPVHHKEPVDWGTNQPQNGHGVEHKVEQVAAVVKKQSEGGAVVGLPGLLPVAVVQDLISSQCKRGGRRRRGN